MVYSRTQILQKEVFFIDIIDNIPTEKLMHLKAIFFTRCTEENVSKICAQLRDPIFSSYNLCKLLLYHWLYLSRLLKYCPTRADSKVCRSWSAQRRQSSPGSIRWFLDDKRGLVQPWHRVHSQSEHLTTGLLEFSWTEYHQQDSGRYFWSFDGDKSESARQVRQ